MSDLNDKLDGICFLAMVIILTGILKSKIGMLK